MLVFHEPRNTDWSACFEHYAALSPWHWKTPVSTCPTSLLNCAEHRVSGHNGHRAWVLSTGSWKLRWAQRRISRQVWWQQGHLRGNCKGWGWRDGLGEGCGRPRGQDEELRHCPVVTGDCAGGVWHRCLPHSAQGYCILLRVVSSPVPWASRARLGGQHMSSWTRRQETQIRTLAPSRHWVPRTWQFASPCLNFHFCAMGESPFLRSLTHRAVARVQWDEVFQQAP